jgi:hypothetical protein
LEHKSKSQPAEQWCTTPLRESHESHTLNDGPRSRGWVWKNTAIAATAAATTTTATTTTTKNSTIERVVGSGEIKRWCGSSKEQYRNVRLFEEMKSSRK